MQNIAATGDAEAPPKLTDGEKIYIAVTYQSDNRGTGFLSVLVGIGVGVTCIE